MKKFLALFVLLALAASLLVGGASVPLGASVEPELVEGNPSGLDLGFDFSFKPQPEPPPSGTYTFPDGVNTVTIETDGTYFSWSSTIAIDAVIVKGGPNANVYYYYPESYGDNGLHPPVNASGGYAAISHIDFCYDYEVLVSKTAETSYTRTYEWDITKTASPDTWDIFVGDTATSGYTVALTRTAVDSDWAVAGTITVSNPTPFVAYLDTITDTVATGIPAVVEPWPATIPPWGSIEVGYSAALPNGADRVNTATVDTFYMPASPVRGNSGSAPVTFGEPTTIAGYPEVNVSDSNGGFWTFAGSGYVNYTADFAGLVPGTTTYLNTATIAETGQSAVATVDVNVYELLFGDAADIDFTRTYYWTIDKSADQTDLLLTTGQQYQVNYTVTVDATYADSDYVVTGVITITNPAPVPAEIVSVAISGAGVAVAMDSGPYTIPASGTLEVPYSMTLPEVTAFSVDIVQQNYSYDQYGAATATDVNAIGGASSAAFGAAELANEVDEMIDVNDTNVGFLGTVAYGDLPVSFAYSLWVGTYDLAGTYYVDNIAGFVTNDTQTTGEDPWTVTIVVPQEGVGATLTQGYWKTHSKYGPAPYDEAWENIGEDTPFFLSGQTYYEVLWAKSAGDPYYTLAVQYIAAELNILNGADPTDVEDTMAAAYELLSTKAPAGKLKGAEKAAFISLASILDDYNNGVIGPGHADE